MWAGERKSNLIHKISSSLVALTGKTPYSTLITHGFALDEQGRKMSKSLGNTIVPSLIIEGGKVSKVL